MFIFAQQESIPCAAILITVYSFLSNWKIQTNIHVMLYLDKYRVPTDSIQKCMEHVKGNSLKLHVCPFPHGYPDIINNSRLHCNIPIELIMELVSLQEVDSINTQSTKRKRNKKS